MTIASASVSHDAFDYAQVSAQFVTADKEEDLSLVQSDRSSEE